jgi:hypothetical protein
MSFKSISLDDNYINELLKDWLNVTVIETQDIDSFTHIIIDGVEIKVNNSIKPKELKSNFI